ncbi:hypothetical protein [Cytobacillus sp. IB215665]|uniref:hypothetical protein n=1 Tax=Cytobacillus sp. IB215665 TaxID=3097357 RepID=UPI002A158133|nr:hypothetical protein [Cytobacillus sp. IB215665]MDX8366415.1 hypothetical protein [Cytobacillus sp. IB215665]
MKKILYCLLASFIMSSCTNAQEPSSNEAVTIMPIEVDQREKNLLDSIAGDQLFAFDVKVNDKTTEEQYLNISIDYYENGDLLKEVAGMGVQLVKDVNTVLISRVEEELNDDKYIRWGGAVVTESGFSKFKSNMILANNNSGRALSSQLSNERLLYENKPQIVAYIINHHERSISATNNVFDGVEKEINRIIQQYESVYFVTVELDSKNEK